MEVEGGNLMAFGRVTPFTPVILASKPGPALDHAKLALFNLHSEIHNTMDTERSRKVGIGISEVGHDCDRCVVRKMSQQYVKLVEPGGKGWRAQVGTFGHAGLEAHFGEGNLSAFAGPADPWEVDDVIPATDAKPLLHLERKLRIRQYKTFELNGSCDAYVEGQSFGVVTDWKFQGKNKLGDSAKGKISDQYLTQMAIYGLGWRLLGKPVTHTLLYALPRDDDLDAAKPVLLDYDEDRAAWGLARLERFENAALALEAAYPGEGWQRLMDAQASAGGYTCDCRAYDQKESKDFFSEMFE